MRTRTILAAAALALLTLPALAGDPSRDVVQNLDSNATDNPALANRLAQIIDLQSKTYERLEAIDLGTPSLSPVHGLTLDAIHQNCLDIQEAVASADGSDWAYTDGSDPDGSSTYRRLYRLWLTLESVDAQIRALPVGVDAGMLGQLNYGHGIVSTALAGVDTTRP